MLVVDEQIDCNHKKDNKADNRRYNQKDVNHLDRVFVMLIRIPRILSLGRLCAFRVERLPKIRYVQFILEMPFKVPGTGRNKFLRISSTSHFGSKFSIDPLNLKILLCP